MWTWDQRVSDTKQLGRQSKKEGKKGSTLSFNDGGDENMNENADESQDIGPLYQVP